MSRKNARSSSRAAPGSKRTSRIYLAREPAVAAPASWSRFPTEAADDYQLVRDLITAGMDVARINTGHDGPDIWLRMVENIERAKAETGRACRISIDLEGPKLRTGELQPGRGVFAILPARDPMGKVSSAGPRATGGRGRSVGGDGAGGPRASRVHRLGRGRGLHSLHRCAWKEARAADRAQGWARLAARKLAYGVSRDGDEAGAAPAGIRRDVSVRDRSATADRESDRPHTGRDPDPASRTAPRERRPRSNADGTVAKPAHISCRAA